jgi:hypothetical protein
MGKDNDYISIDVKNDTGSAWGLNNVNTFDTGAGHDKLVINVQGGQVSYGIEGGTVTMGEGNDTVSIDVRSTSSVANSVYNATIDMGEGSDILMLKNGLIGYATLLGGKEDEINFENAQHVASLGDILGLGGNLALDINKDGNNSSIFTSHNTINGFESLLVNLADNNSRDQISLDKLLAGVEQLKDNGNNNVQSLVIMTDSYDTLNYGDHRLTPADPSHPNQLVTIDGLDGLGINSSFYHYTANDGELHIYIQYHLLIT